MTRIKRGVIAHKRRKNVLKKAKGFEYGRKNKYVAAKDALMHAGVYAYRDRRAKKRLMRGLWQIRLNAAAREYGLSYSKFMNAIKKTNIGIDRKVLADLALNNPEIFAKVMEKAKSVIK